MKPNTTRNFKKLIAGVLMATTILSSVPLQTYAAPNSTIDPNDIRTHDQIVGDYNIDNGAANQENLDNLARDIQRHIINQETNFTFRVSYIQFQEWFVKAIQKKGTGFSKPLERACFIAPEDSSMEKLAYEYLRGNIYSEGYKASWEEDVYDEEGNEVISAVTIKCTYTYSMTKDMSDEVEKAAKEYAKKLEGKSDLTKIRAIYDHVCSLTEYDYDTLEKRDSGESLSQEERAIWSPWGVLHGKAVCQGYSDAFYRFCDAAGIDSVEIGGMAYDNVKDAYFDFQENHAWNMVSLNNIWYNMDATWDDNGSNANEDYFLKNDKEFFYHMRNTKPELKQTDRLKHMTLAATSYKITEQEREEFGDLVGNTPNTEAEGTASKTNSLEQYKELVKQIYDLTMDDLETPKIANLSLAISSFEDKDLKKELEKKMSEQTELLQLQKESHLSTQRHALFREICDEIRSTFKLNEEGKAAVENGKDIELANKISSSILEQSAKDDLLSSLNGYVSGIKNKYMKKETPEKENSSIGVSVNPGMDPSSTPIVSNPTTKDGNAKNGYSPIPVTPNTPSIPSDTSSVTAPTSTTPDGTNNSSADKDTYTGNKERQNIFCLNESITIESGSKDFVKIGAYASTPITYSSDNPSVISCNSDIISTKRAGFAIITIKAVETDYFTGATAVVPVNILPKKPVVKKPTIKKHTIKTKLIEENKDDGDGKYTVQISKKKDFSKILKEKETSKSTITFKKMKKGTYFIRTKFTVNGATSKWSDRRRAVVKK